MQITDSNQLLELKDNKFIGKLPELNNTQINFKGKNNIFVCEENVKLLNSRIDFNLDNSLLYLSSNSHDYAVNISIHKDNVCFIGKNNFFNGLTTIVLSEAKNVVIGNDCLLSYHVIFRVSDGHAIYDSESKDRINYSKSIYIGDHVWLGQNTMIFKGVQIGSGSIIGAGSIVSNKIIPSNTTYAGSPVRLIKEDTFWIPHSVHGWSEKEINKMSKYKSDLFIFNEDTSTLDFKEIEDNFNNNNINKALEFIETNLITDNKNRFFIKEFSKNKFSSKPHKWSRILNR